MVDYSRAPVFPPEGATATYRVVSFGGQEIGLPGRVEDGVEWRRET